MRVRPNFWDFQDYQKPEFLTNLQSLQSKDPERYKKNLNKYQSAMKGGHYDTWLKDKDKVGSPGYNVGMLPSGVYDPKDIKRPAPDDGRWVMGSMGKPIHILDMLSRGK